MRSYNPEQIMLSAVVRRPSRDVNIMKEKLIFSGETHTQTHTSHAVAEDDSEDGDEFVVRGPSSVKQTAKTRT